LNFDKLPEVAQQVARETKLVIPVKNPFRSIMVRSVEIVFACAEALRIIREYEPPPVPRVEVPNQAGVGQAITEAPRGILYHRYAMDEKGLIIAARIIPPTAQNQKRIEDDLRDYAVRLVDCREVTITSCYASKLVWQQEAKSLLPATKVQNSAALLNRVLCLRATSFAPNSS
jgi:coenzyme F420-reducing hydrogenase alpha subunit